MINIIKKIILAQMLLDYANGMNVKDVINKHNVSRRTLYRYADKMSVKDCKKILLDFKNEELKNQVKIVYYPHHEKNNIKREILSSEKIDKIQLHSKNIDNLTKILNKIEVIK